MSEQQEDLINDFDEVFSNTNKKDWDIFVKKIRRRDIENQIKGLEMAIRFGTQIYSVLNQLKKELEK